VEVEVSPLSFRREIAPARTFGFLHEVEHLRAKGLARGGSLENAIVVSGDGILNEEPLRFRDEFVRHKVLDALGDLMTLGHPMMGHLVLYKAGHDLMNQLVSHIINSKDSYRLLDLGREVPTFPPYQVPFES
jgi:UDP-3-O-[3-hydroxymyristoyl] N-acetylglucosamine deacetylase